MAFKTDFEALILGAVAAKPLHGYGIVKVIREGSGGALKAGEGQLYPILHRMEGLGWLAADWESQEGRPPRKVYDLTDKGRVELARSRKRWAEFSQAVSSIIAPNGRKEANENA